MTDHDPQLPDRRRFLQVSAGMLAGLSLTGVATACGGSSGGSAGRSGHSTPPTTADTARLAHLATDAFYAGVPLVVTTRTLQTFSHLFGTNTLFVTPGLVKPASRLVVSPNRDTVYVLAVLDLRAGPLVLTLPDVPDRYHVYQFLDAWMGGFGLVGTRSTGGRGGTWVIARDGEAVDAPAGAKRLTCPTDQAFILGRIRAIDDADAAAAVAVGRKGTLAPLMPGTKVPPMPEPIGPASATGTNGVDFFDEVCDALVLNPPVTPQQRAAITAAKALGIVAGATATKHVTAEQRDVLRRAVTNGLHTIETTPVGGSTDRSGWDVNLELGNADTSGGLLQRAIIAKTFWGPVPAAEAVYPHARVASDGKPLDGSKHYRIHFPVGGLPPVNAFWSLTVYGPDHFLVPNSADRYSISGDSPGLVFGADGSLDIYLQRTAPAEHEEN